MADGGRVWSENRAVTASKKRQPGKYEGWPAENFSAYLRRVQRLFGDHLSRLDDQIQRYGPESREGAEAIAKLESSLRALTEWDPVREARMQVLQTLDNVVSLPVRLASTTAPKSHAEVESITLLMPGYPEWRSFIRAYMPKPEPSLEARIEMMKAEHEVLAGMHTAHLDLGTLTAFLQFALLSNAVTSPFTPERDATPEFWSAAREAIQAWGQPKKRNTGNRFEACARLLRQMGFRGHTIAASSLKPDWTKWRNGRKA